MNEQAIRKIFPRASKSTIEANANGGETGAESERALRDGPLAKAQGKARYAGRYVVSVTSYRVRTVDPDNLCAKWFIDSLRYAGILHDDRESDIIYQISQKKVAHKTEEKTLIEIWPEQSSEDFMESTRTYYKASKVKQKKRRKKAPLFERPHLRLCDGSLRYADKDYTPRKANRIYSFELLAFYQEMHETLMKIKD